MATKAQLKKDGPMYCKKGLCPQFRKRNPKFAQKMQDAGIVAHYMGKGWPTDKDEFWYLSGITAITRATLERLIRKRGQ